jgi:lipid-A-disaccharide synthase
MPKFMVIAGEVSGDALAAELVRALRGMRGLEEAQFFGAGGPKMAAAGVELAFDLTKDSVIGVSAAVGKFFLFRERMAALLRLATERRPDVVLLVDFSFFNHLFAQKLRAAARSVAGWNPKIVKYVSPQVWASRPKRADRMARDFDLLLSIFPFEKEWFRKRAPELRVEFVGHPLVERYGEVERAEAATKTVLLLPGSRRKELEKHLPPMLESIREMRTKADFHCRMVLPSQALAELARMMDAFDGIEVEVGNLPERLQEATVAIASSGTVTMECAFFRTPTVVIYKTSALTYFVAKKVVTVKWLAMPNILADETIFPEFIQGDATGPNLARAALDLLNNPERRSVIKAKLDAVIRSLGAPGASGRAAALIAELALGQNEPIMQAKA